MFRAFHVCLKLQKHCKYQHFLRSTRQKCCNLQCFFAWLSKTLVFAVFCASRVQKVLVFTAFSAFVHGSRQRRLKRKNVVIYSILWLPKSEKSSEKCVKTAFFSDFRTSKTHLEISPSFCPPQTPKNVKTPPGWRILGEGRRHRRAPG